MCVNQVGRAAPRPHTTWEGRRPGWLGFPFIRIVSTACSYVVFGSARGTVMRTPVAADDMQRAVEGSLIRERVVSIGGGRQIVPDHIMPEH